MVDFTKLRIAQDVWIDLISSNRRPIQYIRQRRKYTYCYFITRNSWMNVFSDPVSCNIECPICINIGEISIMQKGDFWLRPINQKDFTHTIRPVSNFIYNHRTYRSAGNCTFALITHFGSWTNCNCRTGSSGTEHANIIVIHGTTSWSQWDWIPRLQRFDILPLCH